MTTQAKPVTIGVDFSTTKSNRGVVRIDWEPTPTVTLLRGDHRSIDGLVALASVGTMAIDAPFGWPIEFRRFVADPSAYLADKPNQTYEDLAPSLRLRNTDHWVKSQVDVNPLSVSMDKLGATSTACAVLRRRIHDEVSDAEVIEVYPAASALRLGLKKQAADRWTDILDAIALNYEEEPNDHEVDAVLAAITARCHDLGLTEQDPAAEPSEGSIVLPSPGALVELAR